MFEFFSNKKKKWFDREKFIDMQIGHAWILLSNKPITEEQHRNWIMEAFTEWKQIRKERGMKIE